MSLVIELDFFFSYGSLWRISLKDNAVADSPKTVSLRLPHFVRGNQNSLHYIDHCILSQRNPNLKTKYILLNLMHNRMITSLPYLPNFLSNLKI